MFFAFLAPPKEQYFGARQTRAHSPLANLFSMGKRHGRYLWLCLTRVVQALVIVAGSLVSAGECAAAGGGCPATFSDTAIARRTPAPLRAPMRAGAPLRLRGGGAPGKVLEDEELTDENIRKYLNDSHYEYETGVGGPGFRAKLPGMSCRVFSVLRTAVR